MNSIHLLGYATENGIIKLINKKQHKHKCKHKQRYDSSILLVMEQNFFKLNQSINQSDDERRLRWASMSVSVLNTACHFNNNFHYHTQDDNIVTY